MDTKAIFDKLNKACARFTPLDKAFTLWVDRQQRPTFGATVRELEGKCRTRRELDNALFKLMVSSLSELLGSVEKPYLTYHAGTWQRQKKHLAVKAHLTTEAFLELTDKICEESGIGRDSFDSKEIKVELQKRQNSDYHYEKIDELFSITDREKFAVLAENLGRGKYRVFTTKETRYPVLLLASDAARSSAISAEMIPEALNELEDYLIKEWGVKGYAIGMLGQHRGNSFKLAAVLDEDDYCDHVDGHDQKVLKEQWQWKEPKRRYHHQELN